MNYYFILFFYGSMTTVRRELRVSNTLRGDISERSLLEIYNVRGADHSNIIDNNVTRAHNRL